MHHASSMKVKICSEKAKKSKELSTHSVHILTSINDTSIYMLDDHDILAPWFTLEDGVI